MSAELKSDVLDVRGGAVKPNPPGSGGIFITRGSTLRLTDLRIEIKDDGLVDGNLNLSLAQDVTADWLEIALSHCREAQAHSALVQERVRIAEDQELGSALEAEFRSCMQACVAAAVAVDAFYGRVSEYMDIPRATVEAWKHNRTARHARIAEVLRRAFEVHPSKVAELKKLLKEIFHYRDRAVHPPPTPTQPARRPDLNLGLEWRFVAFRLYNARVITKLCISLVWQCSGVARKRYPELVKYCEGLRTSLEPVRAEYADLFGHDTEQEETPE